jgi:DNA polymerase elongation subunit (family B)
MTFQRDETEDEKNPGAFVHLISYITAAARAHLQSIRRLAGVENTIYSDTDSVVVTASGYERVKSQVDAVRLGALKVEHWLNFLHVMSPKFYIMEDVNGEIITKSKGVNVKGMSVAE